MSEREQSDDLYMFQWKMTLRILEAALRELPNAALFALGDGPFRLEWGGGTGYVAPNLEDLARLIVRFP